MLTNQSVNGDWPSAIQLWTVWMRAAKRPETSIYLRRSQILRLARRYPTQSPWELSTGELLAWLADHDWGTNTARSHRSALRAFYSWGRAQGYVLVDPAFSLPSIRAKKTRPRPTPELIIAEALARVDIRTRLMMELAGMSGMRRAEVASSRRIDAVRLDGADWMHIHGKGDRERVVPLPEFVAAEIRALPDGWLFPSPLRPGGLTPAYVGKLVSRAMPAGWTMHTLRHRYATVAYAVDHDLLAVMELLGHASVATTQIYTLTPSDSLRRAAAAAGIISAA